MRGKVAFFGVPALPYVKDALILARVMAGF
jgi:hypothetical protein